MPNFNLIGGGISDLFSAAGDAAEASAYGKAAQYAAQNAQLAVEGTKISEAQASRAIFQTIGSQKAQVAGAGFAQSGSSADLFRSSVQQGAIQKGLIQVQGDITQTGYLQEESAYKGMQQAAIAASAGSTAAGIGGILGGIFSDAQLKEDIIQVGTRDDGIGIYTFRYKGQPDTWMGLMAQDVMRTRPDAILQVDGYMQVDYAALDYMPLRIG